LFLLISYSLYIFIILKQKEI